MLEALKECGKRFYHRVVDTTAFAKQEILLEVAKHTELFLVDLKEMNTGVHKKFTGVGNEKILSNIVELAKTSCDIIFRMPLIKGVNSNSENIEETARFINSLEGNRTKMNLLPYHNIAENKYTKLGNPTGFVDFETPSDDEIKKCILIFEEYGIEATVGG